MAGPHRVGLGRCGLRRQLYLLEAFSVKFLLGSGGGSSGGGGIGGGSSSGGLAAFLEAADDAWRSTQPCSPFSPLPCAQVDQTMSLATSRPSSGRRARRRVRAARRERAWSRVHARDVGV